MESYDIKSHSTGPTRGFAVPFQQGNGGLIKEPIEDYIKYIEENAKRVNEFVRKLIGGKKND